MKTAQPAPELSLGEFNSGANGEVMKKSEKLISATKAGDMLGLDAKTLLARKSGTEKLTRVPIGKRGVRFVESEVQALVLKWIAAARKQKAEEEAAKTPYKLHLVPDPDEVQNMIRRFQS